jgi:hypothetical protein
MSRSIKNEKRVVFKNGDKVKTFDGAGTVVSKFKDLRITMIVVRYWVKHKAKYRYDVVESYNLQFQIKLKKEQVKYNKKILKTEKNEPTIRDQKIIQR